MQPDNEVSAQAAFVAAEDRALRTTKALIMSEALVVTLRANVERLERENTEYAARLADYEGVKENAAHDEAGATASDGEAYPSHAFSD